MHSFRDERCAQYKGKKMSEISERLKIIRGDISQTEFAQLFEFHRNTLVKYETGLQLPTTDFLLKLCNKFNISSDWLLFGIEPKKKDGPNRWTLSRTWSHAPIIQPSTSITTASYTLLTPLLFT